MLMVEEGSQSMHLFPFRQNAVSYPQVKMLLPKIAKMKIEQPAKQKSPFPSAKKIPTPNLFEHSPGCTNRHAVH